jgi:hypothetical protein
MGFVVIECFMCLLILNLALSLCHCVASSWLFSLDFGQRRGLEFVLYTGSLNLVCALCFYAFMLLNGHEFW